MLDAVLAGLLVLQPSPAESPAPVEPPPATSPSPQTSTAPTGTLTVAPAEVNLNPAQERVVNVTGATAPLTATLDQKLVRVTVDPNATVVTIDASQQTGSDVLHITDASGARADVPIRVAFNAGTIVPQTALTVTGDPADPSWLARQVRTWVARLTQAQPNAQTTIGNVDAPAQPLPTGAQQQFTVPVQITSDGRYFDQTGQTVVTVQNVAAQPIIPTLLFYDDDPEHVTADGVLFRGTVTAADPARLYYYHDNAGDPRRIVVLLTTNAADPATVQLVDVPAGPNPDVMQVGHAVSREFLVRKSHGEGIQLQVAQGVPFALRDAAMNARDGVAGSVDLRVLAGGPITVTVVAASPGVDSRSLVDAPQLPDDGHARTGVFHLGGYGADTLSFSTGGADAKLVIGDREPTPPSADPNTPGRDYGDYGVAHNVDVTLANPSDVAATAYLYFRPLAGIARGSFLVDGRLVELGCARQPVPYQIAAFELQPQQTTRAIVQTMTDGGSFYPVEIGITGTPPTPATPAISAPDGCFPKP
jgi:hypothetical protein